MPDELHTKLKPYLTAIKAIEQFHADSFYPSLLLCETRITAICDLLKNHIDALDLNPYIKYAAFVSEALNLVENHVRQANIFLLQSNSVGTHFLFYSILNFTGDWYCYIALYCALVKQHIQCEFV